MAGTSPAQHMGRSMDDQPATDQATSAFVASAYESYRPALLRYLTSITRDPSLAEDLVQDAFLRMTVEVTAGRTPDDPAAWLHRVGHNLAMSVGRRRSVALRPYRVLKPPDDPVSPEEAVVGSEQMHELEEVLVDLDPVHRKALTLAALGYDAHAIARSIGRTDGATRTMLCRVRAKVRAQVAASIQPIAS